MNVDIQKRDFTDAFLIICGILSAGLGLESFLIPSGFVDGGATGIALLVTTVTPLPLPLLIILVNIPFIIMAIKVVNEQFAVRTVMAILALSLCIALVPFPHLTDDKLLIAVFGGFFLGAGIGLAVRGGAVIDGTEVMAIFLSKRMGMSIGDVILVINIIIFSVAAWLLSIEIALYAILTYLAASKTVDFVLEGIEEYTGVTIISQQSEEIRQAIIHKMRRGVTIYEGRKGYGAPGERTAEVDILFTVVTRLELNRLKAEINLIDPNAFIIMNSLKDTKGGMIKKRPMSH